MGCFPAFRSEKRLFNLSLSSKHLVEVVVALPASFDLTKVRAAVACAVSVLVVASPCGIGRLTHVASLEWHPVGVVEVHVGVLRGVAAHANGVRLR